MKSIITFILVLSTAIAFAQPEYSDLSRQVLTIGIHGRTNCQPPGSSIRIVPDGAWEKIMDKTNAEAIGTGFIYEYNNEKYIITCEHVVFRASEIKGYDSAYNAYDLEYVGQDTFYDLTVLKFKNKSDAVRFTSVRLNTEPAVPGTLVWNIGYWAADGKSNRRAGEVITGNAMIESDEVVAGKIEFIETTATLLRGYSGGPLYNDATGEVLGMNTKRHNGYNMYYTLRSSTVERVVRDIINYGGVRRAYLGLRFSQSKRANQPVIINAVLDDSPASKKKNILLNSQVRRINGKPVKTIYDALKIMEQIAPNTEVVLDVNKSPSSIKIKAQVIDNQRLKQIAKYAIRENTDDDCIDIIEKGTHVTLIRSNDVEMNIETLGFRLNEQDYLIYCLNDLVQFGTLTRLLGLYGRLEVDDHKRHYSPLKIRLSPTPDKRVLYY